MSGKKLLLIAAVLGAFAFISVPKSDAGVHVGIGLGFPIAYPGYAYPYYPVVYSSPFVYSRPVVVFRNGHRSVRHHHPHR